MILLGRFVSTENVCYVLHFKSITKTFMVMFSDLKKKTQPCVFDP